ncbi:MAG: hypothetical protein Q8900_12830 [Bacillota bacterium]|nr:hypothetical protein [Bacillota bacterium]
MKKNRLIMLLAGIALLVISIVFLIYTYINTTKISSMIIPIIIIFIPFVFSFILLSLSLKKPNDKK